MSKNQSSYRQIMKATSLFGGVQVFNILISIIRSKFVAVLLGPAGMGITGLLTSACGMIGALTNCGLATSAVKDVVAANATGDQLRIATVVSIFRRLVWVTGILGMVLTIILSPLLSQLTFGSKNYTFAFICISVTLLFGQLTSGQMVILQGMRKMQYLAKANISGSLIGLIICVPLYYIWKIDAIVPVILVTSIISLSLTWYFARKIKIKSMKVPYTIIISEGKKMLTMGFMISLSGLISLGTSYIVRIFISNTGGIEQVGLYTAGFAVINTYAGMVFSAMGTDYYPRLSAVSHSNPLCRQTINQQAEIGLLILAPIILIFLVFIRWMVVLLYSDSFIGVINMIHWAALGMLLRAASWSIGFIFLAKSSSKMFFWNELIANIYMLLFNIIGYRIAGLTGLGVSFMAGYMVHLFQVFIITKIKYQFGFDRSFIRIFLFQLMLALICFIVVKIIKQPYSYVIGIVLIILSLLFSFRELDKRIGLKDIMRRFRK